jgi:Holliday junction resolvase RusA-like endonuclease
MINQLIVIGIPVSAQTKTPKNRVAWTKRVREAARAAIAEEDRHEFVNVSVVIVQYCFGWSEGDLDNIAKPILDGLSGPAYPDDRWVTQLTLRRTDLSATVDVHDPPPPLLDALAAALKEERDFIYIRVEDEADHRRLPWNT